jgi:hypothetical protein
MEAAHPNPAKIRYLLAVGLKCLALTPTPPYSA